VPPHAYISDERSGFSAWYGGVASAHPHTRLTPLSATKNATLYYLAAAIAVTGL
jgi:hypothetical protein